ncbi:hypothetical protein EBR66_01835 [bacterium]|nr:hypothetical protein [bacterium]
MTEETSNHDATTNPGGESKAQVSSAPYKPAPGILGAGFLTPPQTVTTPPPTPGETPLTLQTIVPEKRKMPDMKEDIARILKEIQLPERRDVKNTPPAVAPTAPRAVQPQSVPPERQAPPEPLDVPLVSGMHTLKDDLVHAARVQNITVIKATALEEQKRHQEKPKDFDKAVARSKVSPALTASSILFVLGVAALVGVYLAMPQATETTVAVPDSLMFAEQTARFPLNQESSSDTRRLLSSLRNQGVTLGAMLRIAATTNSSGEDRLASAEEFIRSLGTQAPESFMRSLQGIPFIGIHSVDQNAPVLVFKVSSYENAFAGMLSWEKTINQDLSPFFTAIPDTVVKNGVPTVRTFSDEVIKNYDIRALRDDNGKIVMYYSFPSRSILIIAESPFSFTELLTRLRAQREL